MVRTLRKRLTISTGAILAVYSLLVAALTHFERMSEAANVTNLPKAFAYSLLVIFTRSYGDLYPVTPYGRLVGMAFLVFGLFVYCLVIAAAISFFASLWKKTLRHS